MWQDDVLLRRGDLVAFPITWLKEPAMSIYAVKSTVLKQQLPKKWKDTKELTLYRITAEGLLELRRLTVVDRAFEVEIEGGVAYLVKNGG